MQGAVGGNLTSYPFEYLHQNKIGRVFLENIGSKRSGVAFVSLEKFPVPLDNEIPYAPDLAVEVISRTDDWSEIAVKAKQYLQSQSQLVWVIDPYTKSVFVFRPNQPLSLLTISDELSDTNLSPGFKLAVSALFE